MRTTAKTCFTAKRYAIFIRIIFTFCGDFPAGLFRCQKLADYIASPDITKQVETANTQMGKDGRVSLASEGKTVVMTVTLNNSLFGSQPLDTVKQNLRSKKDLFADQYATIGGQIVKQIQQQTKLEDLHLKLNICTEDGEAIITKTYDEKSSSSALKNSQSGSSSPSSSSSH